MAFERNRAKQEGISTAEAADRMAFERVQAARGPGGPGYVSRTVGGREPKRRRDAVDPDHAGPMTGA